MIKICLIILILILLFYFYWSHKQVEHFDCMSDSNTYQQLVNTVKKIENDPIITDIINSGKASSESITNFKSIQNDIQKKIDSYNKLSLCSDYCLQGLRDPSSNNCVCTSPNIPINYNNQIYCYTRDCSNIPNMSFKPGKDPESNSCECNSGYVFNETKNNCIKV